MLGSLLDFKPQNNRISKIRLKGRFRNITVISAYAPMNNKRDQKKERFDKNQDEASLEYQDMTWS
jgi:hypothetical protein